MPTPFESADLLMKLYELRRDPLMREARTWFAREFNPSSIDDVASAATGPHNAHFRMVTSYWDMAASFVANGAIDEKMFNDANGEQLVILAKLEPFLAEYRSRTGNPNYLAHLEKLVMKRPRAKETMAAMRERFLAMAAAKP